MIPKVIHYCWFGRAEKPKLVKKCIKSWKKYCPDFEIIEWNEDNFDLNCCAYVKEAYEAKKWAFVSDYARLKIIYTHGGIYLDTDVELIKPINDLLNYDCFFGFEDEKFISTGLGFGAKKNTDLIMEMMFDYEHESFILPDGKYNDETCPVKNLKVFMKNGFKPNNTLQIVNNVAIFPSDFFCPYDFKNETISITKNTYSIHHYSASWWTKEQKEYAKANANKAYARKHFGKLGEKIYTLFLSIKEIGIKNMITKIVKKFTS